MIKEIIETGKTIEMAVKSACEKLGVSEYDVDIEVLETPKRSLLGLKHTPAKIRVVLNINKVDYAREFLCKIISEMGISNFDISCKEEANGVIMTVIGEDLKGLIGRHGDTLDAIQYIVGLAVNQIDDEYFRVTLDCGNYREKRLESLEEFAKKTAKKVLKYGKPIKLEAMNPYERRIVHASVQNIENISSTSEGVDPNRYVVVSCTNPVKRSYNKSNQRKNNYNNRNSDKKPYTKKYDNKNKYSGEKSKAISDKNNTGSLYGKIDL